MIIRRLLAVFVLLFASLGLVTTPSAYAADCVPGRGVDPLPALQPGGQSFELLDAEAEAGGTIRFKASGFKRDQEPLGGQTLNFKLNDIDPAFPPGGIKADDAGNVEGTLTLPTTDAFRALAECGAKKWWVRVLVGAGAENDSPAGSHFVYFDLTTDLGSTDTDPSESSSPTPTTTSTTSGTTPTTSGTLPQTGIEDHGVLLATSGLALAALLALVVDRRLRRRRLTESA